MKVRITSPSELGEVIRSVRKTSGIRIDDAAYMTGVSKQFASDVEHGKPTAEFGRVLMLLTQLGIELEVNIPSDAKRALDELRARGGIRAAQKRWTKAYSRTATRGRDASAQQTGGESEDIGGAESPSALNSDK